MSISRATVQKVIMRNLITGSFLVLVSACAAQSERPPPTVPSSTTLEPPALTRPAHATEANAPQESDHHAALEPPAPATGNAVATERSEAPKGPGEARVGDRSSCLVSGESFTVKSGSPKVAYKGKTYFFCCPGCDKKFLANPEKYLNKR